MKSQIKYLFLLLFLIFNQLAFAKPLNLLDQPKPDAKVIGQVDPEAGIIPIFSPKDSAWIKVADPRNGNVGWIKSTDLSDSPSSFTFSQKIISGPASTPQSYVIQVGIPQKLTQDTQKMMKEMELRQQAIQKEMQQMMNTLFSNTKAWTMPIFVPVVVVPTGEPAVSTKK